MTPVRPRLIDYTSASDALTDLCNGFTAPPIAATTLNEVQPDEMPPPFRDLLVHHSHMTTTLSGYYRRPLELRVLREEVEGDLYHRQIVLTSSGSNTVVECGLVRIDLSFTPEPVREAILRRETPLGDILIEHDVLRRIEPRWYLRLEPHSPLLKSFDCSPALDTFGRVGTIYCNDQPAIELLEVVTGVSLQP